jgi:hypothetical protein
LRNARWAEQLQRALAAQGRKVDDLATLKKGESWKFALAQDLRTQFGVPCKWLSQKLDLGTPHSTRSLHLWRKTAWPQMGVQTFRYLLSEIAGELRISASTCSTVLMMSATLLFFLRWQLGISADKDRTMETPSGGSCGSAPLPMPAFPVESALDWAARRPSNPVALPARLLDACERRRRTNARLPWQTDRALFPLQDNVSLQRLMPAPLPPCSIASMK